MKNKENLQAVKTKCFELAIVIIYKKYLEFEILESMNYLRFTLCKFH